MRIKKLTVVNLFDMFNHEVDMNLDDRITIIHGVNGIGKTALLRLINAVFNRQIPVLQSIPYDKFRIDFDNGTFIEFNKTASKAKEPKSEKVATARDEIKISWKQKGKRVIKGEILDSFDPRDLTFPLSFFERYIPGLRRVAAATWVYGPKNETLTIDEVVNRFAARLPIPSRMKKYGFPKEVDDILQEIKVRLIRAQRLLVLPDDGGEEIGRYGKDDERKQKVSEAVETYSLELRDKIKTILTESSTLTQSLDRTFPQRLIDSYGRSDKVTNVSKDELSKRLENVEKKRNFLMSVGLYDLAKEKIDNPVLNNEDMIRVLTVYVEDTEKKLMIFDELANKISVLIEVINGRFQFKEMTIDKEKGFVFKVGDKNLYPTDLSSGEQHEIVLVYELLFQTGPDTLVLIDEPELSLHVGWQIKFLEDLRRIISLSEIDVLVATHSPQIINNRWDLTVKLDGIEE